MQQDARATLNLLQLHGASELKIGQTFTSGKLATNFLKDYAFNANKNCHLARGSGKSNTYKCSDSKCDWEVRVCRRTSTEGTHVMYVSTLRDVHYDFCTSLAKRTQRQIQLLPTLRAAIMGDRGVKRKALVAMVQDRDHVSLANDRLKLYQAKDRIFDALDGQWDESFSLFPSLLREIHDRNPGTTVHLDLDQHQRFLRAFIAIGSCISSQPYLQPVLGFDRAHSKYGKYNGVILTLIGRDGNRQNVTLALRFANVESERNVLWFLKLCVQSGIAKTNRPVFSDRGKIIGATSLLYASEGVVIELRYCTIHVLRNIKRQFGSRGRAMENAVWNIQGAGTQAESTSFGPGSETTSPTTLQQ